MSSCDYIYWIENTPERFEFARKKLSFDVQGFDLNQHKYKFFFVNDKTRQIGVPRFFGYTNFGVPRHTSFEGVESTELIFSGDLRSYQQKAVEETIIQLNNLGGATMVASCGSGKTVMALYIMSRMKVKTFIVVHKCVLMDQWKERINMFLPSAKVQTVKGKDAQIHDDVDVVVTTVQSLISPNCRWNLSQFGLLVCDEAHHYVAQAFATIFVKIKPRYILGLSATPTRRDFDNLIVSFCGPVATTISMDQLTPSIHLVDALTLEEAEQFQNDVNPHQKQMLKTRLLANAHRCSRIAYIISKMHEEGYHILFITDRLNAIDIVYDMLDVDTKKCIGILKGSTQNRDENISKSIIMASLSIVAEGFDVPRLDCLILGTPVSSIEQIVGRIMRPHPSKKDPIVIDMVDRNTIFIRNFYSRMKYYKKKKYQVTDQKPYSRINNEDDTFLFT